LRWAFRPPDRIVASALKRGGAAHLRAIILIHKRDLSATTHFVHPHAEGCLPAESRGDAVLAGKVPPEVVGKDAPPIPEGPN